MFTGIIQSVGKIISSQPLSGGLELVIDLGALDSSRINLGDSIAVNGTCLTVTKIEGTRACFDVSTETLDKCLISEWSRDDFVNLELALTLNTPIGGHLVSGHVDGTGVLLKCIPGEEYTRMVFKASRDIGRFIATKGSVTVDGISLTSNSVTDNSEYTEFDVMLVPHTLANTTLGRAKVGMSVHLEIDLVARYLQRLIDSDSGSIR
ncbi:MAG: riboflavin synthase [Gammaproteobacteria bacterium]|nr:riboflavin synthase [Gammaproteobacteria bacterium]